MLRLGTLAIVAAMMLAAVVSWRMASNASAAAPHVIVVEGELLDAPVLLQDWTENLELVQAIEGGRGAVPASWDAAKGSRARLDLLYFWMAEPTVTSVSQLGAPEARIPFWPAAGDEAARIGSGEVADARVLAILARHGVPTRVESRTDVRGGRDWWRASVVALGGAFVVVNAWVVVRLRHTSKRRP